LGPALALALPMRRLPPALWATNHNRLAKALLRESNSATRGLWFRVAFLFGGTDSNLAAKHFHRKRDFFRY